MRLILPLAVAIIVADQIVKWWALRDLRFGQSVPVVDGFFSLTLVMNPGLAFGMLGGMPEALRWMVGLLSIGAIVVLAVLAARLLPTGGTWTRLALGLVFGGAAGNLIDRVRFGAVVDFLDFYWRDYHWPAFNVADAAITVGVTIIAIRMLMDTAPAQAAPPGKA
jgi:signal peptidase II